MKLTLQRQQFGKKATIGILSVDDQYQCLTLEDVVRDFGTDGSGKVQNATAIPAGTYKVIIDFSQRFQKDMLHVLNVPFFTGIRIHSGNTDVDTDGCILVGQQEVGPDYIHGGSIELPLLQAKIKAAIDGGEEVSIDILPTVV